MARLVGQALVALGLTAFLLQGEAAAQAPADGQIYKIGFVRQIVERPAWETAFNRPPEDEGLAGARLGIADNMTTGRFLKQTFELAEEDVPADGDSLPAVEKLVEAGNPYILLDVPAAALLRIADAFKGRDVLLFNVGAQDDRLRGADCRANVFHIEPNRAMLTDALAQFLMLKRWRNWLLLVGTREGDRLYAEAVRRSAKKFGARIVAEKVWSFAPDSRRTAQAEVPIFTQGADYDVAVIADELNEFGELIQYQTWDPRLTAGTAGLTAAAWHPAIEAWGAVQFQNRFIRLAKRPMRAKDYAPFVALRAIGEAATRTKSTDPKAVRDYMLGPDFGIAAFKALPLTFRSWDLQLRQSIPLAHPAALVATSPQQGFLHQRTPLDTLGFDQPESACRLGAR